MWECSTVRHLAAFSFMCDVGKWRVKVPERGGNVQKWLDSEIVDTIMFVDLQVTRAQDGTSTSRLSHTTTSN